MTAPARPARTAADLLVDCLAAEDCGGCSRCPARRRWTSSTRCRGASPSGTSRPGTSRAPRSWPTSTAAYGSGRRRDGHARARRDEPRHRHRRRVPRPRPDGRDHRPGVLGQAPQGGPPGRRHRRHVRAGHEMEHARGAGRGDPRDRPQGVPRRDAREARPDPHRAAREPGRLAARGRRRDRTAPAEQDLLPGADRRGHRACRAAARRLGAPDRARRQWCPAPQRLARAARASPADCTCRSR